MATAKLTSAKKAAPKPVVQEIAKPAAPIKSKNTWVYKDRLYEISSGRKPLVFTVPTVHTQKCPLLWFDEDAGYQRELRYATNQKSPFVDEQAGTATMGRITFRDGVLRVPKENVVLQKLLSLYHPYTINGLA